jgi:hypothetical protein
MSGGASEPKAGAFGVLVDPDHAGGLSRSFFVMVVAVTSRFMADVSRLVPKMFDDFVELMERQDGAELRLARALDDQPLGYVLVMAALSWDQVDRRGWRPPEVLGAQARRLAAVWGVATEWVDDADRVAAALEWAMRDPALVERDGQGRYRPMQALVFPVGSRLWREHHRAAVMSRVLTPVELVGKGDADRDASPVDLDAAEGSYRLAVDGEDPDVVALASLRLADLAELREQPVEAARRYADVAALRHPVASPPAVLWLARQAVLDGDLSAARVLAHEVVGSGDERLLPQAWGLLGSLAWQDEDRDGAVAAMRLAVDAAGEWHCSYSRTLAEMFVARGELVGAADIYRGLLDQPLFSVADAERYVQVMAAAGRVDEAVAVLEECVAEGGLHAGDLLLTLASVHAARDDLDAFWRALARVRAHWSAVLPRVSVRADMMEASAAAAVDDDERAAYLFRSLTDTDDAERRNVARPLLIAAGDQLAAAGQYCVIPGMRPLLEYLSEVAEPGTAAWAATSLAHLAVVEGRSNDAEAAVRLAARHLGPDEVITLRVSLLRRALRVRDRDPFAYLADALRNRSGKPLPGEVR